MSWLTNIPPKIRALVRRPEVPDDLWTQCPACEQMIFHRELDAGLRVCPHCGHHMRLDARRRIESLLDPESWIRLDPEPAPADPLRFRDRKRYSERLRDNRSATGLDDAVMAAAGTLGGHPAVVAVFDFRFMGGSMGVSVGNAIVAAAKRAVADRAVLIAVTSSGGARMQEGILSLIQMPRTAIAVGLVKEAGLPYLVILADPTTGGVTASFAMLGDIALAEPGAVVGFAGRRVIEETIRETLPADFQKAEYLMAHGVIDMVVPRHELRGRLIDLVGLLTGGRALAAGNAAAPVPALPATVPDRGEDDADSPARP